MSVKIIIDSTCDLLPETKARCAVVPLTVRFGECEYRDGVDIDHREFYRMLTTGQEMPTTSQASPADFEQVYRDCTADGSQAVVLCVSGKLSGTYQSAVIAAQDYEGQVFVVDSQTVAIGTGILAELFPVFTGETAELILAIFLWIFEIAVDVVAAIWLMGYFEKKFRKEESE